MAEPQETQQEEIRSVLPQAGQCNIWHTIFSLFNVMAGIGVLTTPSAVKEAGWGSLLILTTFAFICWYTTILLKKCMESAQGIVTYADIAEAALGRYGRSLVSVIILSELYAICIEFIILDEDNLSRLHPRASLSMLGFHLDAMHLFGILAVLIVLPTVMIRDMRILSYISVLGSASTIFLLPCLLIVGANKEVGFHHHGEFLNWRGIPYAIGVFGYCFSGHPVIPDIYGAMENKNLFNRATIICFVLCAVVYGGSAILGFLMFGQATQSQITLNLPPHNAASKVAIWTTIINPLTKYGMLMNQFGTSIAAKLPERFRESWWFIVPLRTTLTISTLCVTFFIPFFDTMMALIGSFLSTLGAVILPPLCFLRISRRNASTMQVVLCVSMIIFGTITGIWGTYNSISVLIKKKTDSTGH